MLIQNHHVEYSTEVTHAGTCIHRISICLHDEKNDPILLTNGLPAIWRNENKHNLDREDIDCLLMLHFLFKAAATNLVMRPDLPVEKRLPLERLLKNT